MSHGRPPSTEEVDHTPPPEAHPERYQREEIAGHEYSSLPGAPIPVYKYPITIIGGIIALISISVGGVLAADETRQSAINGIIVALIAPTTIGLMALLRTEGNRNKFEEQGRQTYREIAKTRHDLKGAMNPVNINSHLAAEAAIHTKEAVEKIEHATNGNLEKRIREIAEQVRIAERSQLLDSSEFMERAECMMERVAEKVAERVCNRILNKENRQ